MNLHLIGNFNLNTITFFFTLQLLNMHLSMTDRRTKILRNTVKPVYNDHIVKPVYNDQIQSNLSVSTIEWNSEKDRIRVKDRESL